MNSEKVKDIIVTDGRQIWTVLPKYFLKKFEISIDNIPYRTGIFQNYKTVADQYRIKFRGDVRVMILPTPFEVYECEGLLLLDYRVNTLFRGDSRLINTFKRVKKNDTSVFFDKLLKIKVS